MPREGGRAPLKLTLAFVATGLAFGAWIGVEQFHGAASILDRVETLTLDWRFLAVGPRPAPASVVIAAIDDETLAAAEGHALSRALLAKVVRALAAAGPRAIALDLALPDAKDGDAELADALRSIPSVVAAIAVFNEHAGPDAGDGGLALAPKPSRILWPTDAIRDAAGQVGVANISTDAAGVPRYVPTIFEVEDGVAPSFTLAVAAVAAGADPVVGDSAIRVGDRTTDTDLGYNMPLRYYGPAGSFRRFSASSLLSGDVDAADARGKIVVVGVTATGLADTFATPFDRVVPGVEVVATAIGNLTGADGLERTAATRRIDAATTVVLPAALVAIMGMRRVGLGLAAATALLVLWAAAVFVAFAGGYWVAMAAPLAVAVPLAAAFAGARLVAERIAGRRLATEKSALAKFHSPTLLDHILQPGFLDKPVRQHVVVLFLDLTGSTGVAEALGPEGSRDLLHGLQTLAEREMAAQGGVVLNYMGDGAMAAFGLPSPAADDSARALAAAEGLRKALTVWLAALPLEAKLGLDFRIGAHFGPAVVSRLGSPSHQQIALSGDTVNVASRLLEVAKLERRRVVVSEDLWTAGGGLALSPNPIALTVPIRGRTADLAVRMWGLTAR